jgi:hypothetical protein
MPRRVFTKAETLNSVFDGIYIEGGKRNVCLYLEPSPSTLSTRVYNLDSTIIQLKTLGAIKAIVRWYPAK